MSATVLAVILWIVLCLASVGVWLSDRFRVRRALDQPTALVLLLAFEVGLTGLVALFAALGPPAGPPASWFAVGLGAAAALLTGGAVVHGVLGLVDADTRSSASRVQKTVLRGGAWIGALERLVLFGTVLAGWPEGVAAVVAVKAFARYPELKTGQATGAIERFIIGTFTSLGWAAVCAGIGGLFA